MRVIHTAAELRNQASGPSHSIPHLLYWLNQVGVDASLEALVPVPEQQLAFPQTYHEKWLFMRRLGISPDMKRQLAQRAPEADIIHTHNLWMMPNIYPYGAARSGGCKLIVTPRGTLTKWALQYRKWRKKPLWIAMQRRVVLEADLLHATSADEVEDLRWIGYRGPIALIPNGVEIPPLHRNGQRRDHRTLLFLGRVHPKKGVEKLLRAWERLHVSHPEWHLEIVGPDNEGYRGQMERLASELQLPRCTFRDPVFGEEKHRTYQGADLFILPTFSENFGIAVAEALANGVPAVVTHGAPWEGLGANECGWWIEDGVESITNALDRAMACPRDTLQTMGDRGRAWMNAAFSWEHIATMMKQTYEWVLRSGTRPDWIYTQ